jgi:glycogen operon protein
MRKDPPGALDEFRKMVKALHRAGIEVILDVVFNHTAEGDEDGPTLSFRGLENRAYYLLNPSDRARYADYTGCGNTLNANHSIVRRLILDCLRYWVQAMHVDGFRFDLASVMSRDEEGQPLKNPPILWEIESDPVLAEAKIIAEAWDAAGLYQVGTFIGHRWAEWNGQFRDEARRFVKGDEGMVGRLAQRITGSRDLYRQPDREPNRSVNFITCHDGFTLNDLVSYNVRHNQANALDNHDGVDLNHSWNCGVEGPTADPAIEALRLRQMKNLLTILLTSQGTPMLLMGDEARRTQSGNNNAFCQNNALSWFDWEDLQRNVDLHRFTRNLIRFYQRYSLFHEEHFWADPGGPEVTWHGVKLNQPDWNDYSHSLAYELRYPEKGEHLYVALNAYWEALEFELPPIGFPSVPRSSVNAGGEVWRRFVDTSLPSPEDCCAAASLPPVEGNRYLVQPHSAVILLDC